PSLLVLAIPEPRKEALARRHQRFGSRFGGHASLRISMAMSLSFQGNCEHVRKIQGTHRKAMSVCPHSRQSGTAERDDKDPAFHISVFWRLKLGHDGLASDYNLRAGYCWSRFHWR